MSTGDYPSELKAKRKQAGFKWNGSNIILESRFLVRYLFFATREYLYIDGKLIAETGGFKFRERGAGEFVDTQGNRHQIKFEAGGFFFTWLPCTISIDGEIVYKGAVPLRGIFKPILAIILLTIVGYSLGNWVGSWLGRLM